MKEKVIRWLGIFYCIITVMLIAVFVSKQNWSALMWMVITSILLCGKIRDLKSFDGLQRKVRRLQEYIATIESSGNYQAVIKAENYASVMMENARRYLIRIIELRAEVEQLRILNKNLIENRHTGVKNYAKHTNRRAVKKGDKGDA